MTLSPLRVESSSREGDPLTFFPKARHIVNSRAPGVLDPISSLPEALDIQHAGFLSDSGRQALRFWAG